MKPLAGLILFCAAVFAANELSGRRAPGFNLPDGQFNRYDLQDYRGKVVVLDIIQSKCPHCQALAGTLETLKAKYGGRVMILSVVLPPDTTATVAEFIRLTKTTVPILFDMGQMAASYFNATPKHAHFDVPHVFLIDKQGIIQRDFIYTEATKGAFEVEALSREIDRLL